MPYSRHDLEPPAGVSAVGSVIMLHGLGANRRTMTYLGTDLPATVSAPIYSTCPAMAITRRVLLRKSAGMRLFDRESLVRDGTVDPRKTILLGHSMEARLRSAWPTWYLWRRPSPSPLRR